MPRINDEFAERYIVSDDQPLGKGAFGVVVKVLDKVTNKHCAMKVIKNRRMFYKQAQLEKEILDKFMEGGEEALNESHVVALRSSFVHRDHMCFVFDLLSVSLYDLIKKTRYAGVSLRLVRRFASQILEALRFMERLNIVHCDLKPENILLCSSTAAEVRVIDFGSACFGDRAV